MDEVATPTALAVNACLHQTQCLVLLTALATAKVPDHTTTCRFRRLLVQRGIDTMLLLEVNRQLLEHGLKSGRTGAGVAATIVEHAFAHLKHHFGAAETAFKAMVMKLLKMVGWIDLTPGLRGGAVDRIGQCQRS